MNKFIIILIVFYFCSYCEVINGLSNFRKIPNGPILISLFNNTKVSISHQKDEWYLAGVLSCTLADSSKRRDSVFIKANTILFNCEGEKLGILKKDLIAKVVEGFENDSLMVEITGFIYKNNLKSIF